MNKTLYLIVLITIILLSTGCGVHKVEVDNPLSEEQIITHFQKQIYDETGDNVVVEIVSKKKLEVCTEPFIDASCSKTQFVDGGYSYKVRILNNEIKSKSNETIISTGIYNDGYYIDKEKYNSEFSNNYLSQKVLFLAKCDFINVLDKNFKKYYIYNDVSNKEGYDIFINSSDFKKINNVISEFHYISDKYYNYAKKNNEHTLIVFSLYIYKDENVFNSTNFDLYKYGKEKHEGQSYGKDMIEQYTGKKVVRIAAGEFGNGFDYELFTSNGASAADTDEEYIDYNNFDYLVFWYSERNLQVFGVK